MKVTATATSIMTVKVDHKEVLDEMVSIMLPQDENIELRHDGMVVLKLPPDQFSEICKLNAEQEHLYRAVIYARDNFDRLVSSFSGLPFQGGQPAEIAADKMQRTPETYDDIRVYFVQHTNGTVHRKPRRTDTWVFDEEYVMWLESLVIANRYAAAPQHK